MYTTSTANEQTYVLSWTTGYTRRDGIVVRVPDVVDAEWSKYHPGDQHQRAVEQDEVAAVFAVVLHSPKGKVHGGATPI